MVHLVSSILFQPTIHYIYIYKQYLYYNHSYLFRYAHIILREFQSCTLLKLSLFNIIKIHYNHPAMKFRSEAWVLKKREEQRLEAAQMKFLRHLLGITKLDKKRINVLGKKRDHRT